MLECMALVSKRVDLLSVVLEEPTLGEKVLEDFGNGTALVGELTLVVCGA